MLVAAPKSDSLACATTWQASGTVPKPSTDDHPFPYLKTNTLPAFYLATILLILLVSIVSVRVASGPFRR